MKFSKGAVPLGEGTVTSAAFKDDKIEFLISENGAVIKKNYDTKKKALSRGENISYADECFFIGGGFIERFGANKIGYVP